MEENLYSLRDKLKALDDAERGLTETQIHVFYQHLTGALMAHVHGAVLAEAIRNAREGAKNQSEPAAAPVVHNQFLN